MSTEGGSLDRKDLARLLSTSPEVVRRAEKLKRLGLEEARVSVSQRTVRYSVRRLRRQSWFRRLED